MKKSFIKSTVAFAVMICMLTSLIMFDAVATDPSVSYVALGDSITAGYGLGSLNDSFPTLLAGKLKPDPHFLNKAVSGDTTKDLLAHLETNDYKQAIEGADLITITIGGNDLLAFLYEFLAEKLGKSLAEVTAALESGDYAIVLDAARFIIDGDFSPTADEQAVIAANHAEIVNKLKAINPNATLVIATQYNPYEKLAAQVSQLPSFLLQGDLKTLADAIVKLSASVEESVAVFNKGVTERAETMSYLVADTYTAFKNSSENLSNANFSMSPFAVELDFHPNKAGHAVISECMYAASFSCDHSASSSLPTCTSSAVCSVCGDTINAVAHTPEIIPAVVATCVEAGYTEGSKCSVCNTVIIAPEQIAPNGHSGGKASCKDLAKCEICNAEYGELDPDHTKYMAEGTLYDESKHWHTCLCGTVFDLSDHSFDDNGACTGCLYKKAVDTTAETTTDAATTTSITDIVTTPADESSDKPSESSDNPGESSDKPGESSDKPDDTSADTTAATAKSCAGIGGAFAAVLAIVSSFGIALIKKH